MHAKMYVSFPVEAFMVLGLRRISWPRSYSEKVMSAKSQMSENSAAYLDQTGVEQDACRECIQNTRHGVFRSAIVIVMCSSTVASRNSDGSMNNKNQSECDTRILRKSTYVMME